MQDDKFNIQKILQDDPDRVAMPADSDQDEAVTPLEEVEDVVADEPEDVAELVDADQDADDSDATEEAEEVMSDAEEETTDVDVSQASAEPEVGEEESEPLTFEEKKQRMMKILVPILMVGFVFMAKKSFFPTPVESMAQKIQPAETVNSDTMPQWQAPEEYPSSLRDPMRFGSISGQQYDVEPESLVLKGIVYSSTPAAMINGKIVRTGDEIMGATVVEIKKESVVFRSGDQQWEQKVKR